MRGNPGLAAEPFGGTTVLLVDDEARLRDIVEMMLEDLGASVVVAGDGASALEIFRHRAGEVGAVMLDLRLRGLDGLGVLARLREIVPDVPVLITSGAVPDEEILAGIVSRGCSFIEKPFDVAGLGAALQAAIDGRPVVLRTS